ncbi:hypothetical protein SNR37_003402 [Agarivorans aestuarii]|uniref:Uncharacterized protein n=1 Tax=Agarivorans aestuarii TaxID=1563703 RepID=A0ABU7G6C1_9ALTE|nr:hypothetical protein [Agarivorans aestuarii]MEE1673975.1 hypothetical protein [Agarivorans aestuarii]
MKEDLRIYAKGLAFAGGAYSLRSLDVLISNHRKILDQLIAVSLGKPKADRHIREQIDYKVQVREGSVELLIDFVMNNKELFAPLAADGGYQLSNAIVSLYKDAISLRDAVSKIADKGLQVKISISNCFNFASNNSNVSYNLTDGSILIGDPKILLAAQSTKSAVDNVIKSIDGSNVEYVDFGSGANDQRLNESNKNLLGRRKEEIPATLNIIGRLDMISMSSHRGAIVSDGQRFIVSWDEQLRDKLLKVVDVEAIQFTARPVIDHKSLSEKEIGFHLVDCDELQNHLNI